MLISMRLFFEFLKIGAFSFGGGMSTLPYVYDMAERTNWINVQDVNRLLAVSQVTPGPLACNIGTITGVNVYGLWGSFIANVAFVIPAILFMGVSYKMLNRLRKNKRVTEIIKIVQIGVFAILITSSATLFRSAFLFESGGINVSALILGVIIFFTTKFKKIPKIFFMIVFSVIAGVIGV